MPMYENPNTISRYDLQALENRLLNRLETLETLLLGRLERKQTTYTIKQFAEATGLSYDCVLQRCQRGKLDARQDGAGARWTINGDEMDRYLQEGAENRW